MVNYYFKVVLLFFFFIYYHFPPPKNNLKKYFKIIGVIRRALVKLPPINNLESILLKIILDGWIFLKKIILQDFSIFLNISNS